MAQTTQTVGTTAAATGKTRTVDSRWLMRVMEDLLHIGDPTPSNDPDYAHYTKPSLEIVELCLRTLLSFLRPECYPPHTLYTTDGGIEMSWPYGTEPLEIEIGPDPNHIVVWGYNRETETSWKGTPDEVRYELDRAMGLLDPVGDQGPIRLT